MKRFFAVTTFSIFVLSFSVCYGQKTKKTKPTPQPQTQPTQQQTPQGSTKSSPAYIELTLRKVEVEAELNELLVEYTEEHPKARVKQAEINSLNREMDRIAAMDASMIPRMTATFGKLVLRKVELETEVNKMLLQYEEGHPQIKKTKDKLEIIEREIQRILQ